MSKTYDKEMWHCYRQLFAHSTPSVSFDELVDKAEIDEHGRKHIPFMDYEIDKDIADEIIAQTIKDFRIKPKYKQDQFRVSIYLGCSPKFKRDEEKKIN